MRGFSLLLLLLCAGAGFGAVPDGAAPPMPAAIPRPGAPAPEPLQQILIQRPEPRFVAPTRRDGIGRIWAPVLINGQGPFRLVLDSGASRSGVTAEVAQTLGLSLDQSRPMLLRGVTGQQRVPTVRVDSFNICDIDLDPMVLPIITDALGGAQGILGTDWLFDQRVYIDFRYDLISIEHSRGQRAPPGFITIPFQRLNGQLIVIPAQVGGIRARAIIDTGGEVTVANLALRKALQRRVQRQSTRSQIQGVTNDIQTGDLMATPPIRIGGVTILVDRITYADLSIFQYWKMTDQPVLLVGMDALGLLDTLIIDYQRQELQVRLGTPTS